MLDGDRDQKIARRELVFYLVAKIISRRNVVDVENNRVRAERRGEAARNDAGQVIAVLAPIRNEDSGHCYPDSSRTQKRFTLSTRRFPMLTPSRGAFHVYRIC